MKKRKLTTAFWVRAMLWLLVITFLFTVVSRAAASFTVAQVKVDSPSSRKLLYTVKAEGRIGKNREISVLCHSDILVKSVFVSEGQRVGKGEVLARLDGADIREQVESLRHKKQAYLLQNQEYQKSEEQAARRRSKEIARAKEDYAQVKKKNEAAVAAARKELNKAKQDLKKARGSKAGFDDIDKEAAAALRNEVREKRQALENVLDTKRTEETAAKRALEAALAPASPDSRIDVNRIYIAEIDSEIRKLRKVLRQKCRITAPEDGVVTSILTNVGQRTPDTAVFTMTDDSAGLKFTGQMDMEDAGYVSVGDSITLKNGNKTVEDVQITTMDMDEGKKYMNVTALLPAKAFSLGETVTMIVEQESEAYSCTVPVTAVHQENNKYYVLLMESRYTVLGQQQTAVKIEVGVLERNGQFAALEPSVLSDESQVITDTDRYVAAGDRVRLKGE